MLNKAAIHFFPTLKWDLLNTITIIIGRLIDPPVSFKKFHNASLQQLIDQLDSSKYPDLVNSLNSILSRIKTKSARIEKWRNKWSGHRDFDIIQGKDPLPAITLKEVDETQILIGKFLNEFESVFQDFKMEVELDGNPNLVKELDDIRQLEIYPPTPYEGRSFLPDDGNTIIELVRKANST